MSPTVLLPAEAAHAVRFGPKRLHEFAAVRVRARAALARLGIPAVPLLPGPRGAPGWPGGVVGSMTHCAGYHAAVVARGTKAASIGIDAEATGPLPDGVLRAITLPAERTMLEELALQDRSMSWERLLFSAKESVFKAWYPLTGRELGFQQAVVTVLPATRSFQARLLVPGPVVGGRRHEVFSGRWTCRSAVLATAVVVPARER
uniref:4'-phosphopantetheinyl transferase superfamily protein n=1 Tax=Streptomyces sp. NBC_00003 TaxID=2903608 RepID=A0AAU2V6F8_9ACTN